MKNLVTKLAASILILSSCAQNELIDSASQGTPNDGKIRFAATSALTSTRAADNNPFDNTAALQTLGTFQIDGYYNNTSIYAGLQTVKWQGGSWEYADEPYWPSGDAKINFFAYANWENSGVTLNITKDGIAAAANGGDITIGEDASSTGQKDYLVAATLDATKQSRTLITFKHALTQLIFKAGNVDKDKLDVRIGGVRIVNVKDKAAAFKFDGSAITWTTTASLANANYHVQGLETAADAAWTSSVVVDADKAYTAPVNATLGDYSNYTVIQKTAVTKNNALLLLPQTFTAWDPNKGGNDGSYIELLAVVKDPNKKIDTDPTQEEIDALKPYYYCGAPVFNAGTVTETYGIIRIPVNSTAGDIGEWLAGKRITYLVTFGDKGSGSGGGGYTPDGDPVLVPIRFNAIVEEWVDVNVPLLTATFEATSGAVDGAFVSGYTNQLVNDIKAARIPKVYKSSIKIKGQLSQTSTNQEIVTTGLNMNNILVGSTVTYDFTGINQWGKTLTITAPDGWEPVYYKDAVSDGTKVTSSPQLNGESANIVILTKTEELDANTTYTTAPEYISDYITVIRVNETENNKVRSGWEIKVKGTINSDITFSADELTLLTVTDADTEITVSLAEATFDSGKLIVTVPAGWKATCGSSVTKFVGEKLEVIANDNPIKFIKL